jgi:orotate phosphoribosyltransferase
MPKRRRTPSSARKPARSVSSLKRELLSLIFQKAFQYSDRPVFTLASGRTSPYYIDCKKVTLDPYGAYLVGSLIFDRIKALKPQGIGGLTLGADPIAQAVSLVSHLRRQPVPAFIVRKEPKGHGTAGWIEGGLPERSRVVVVDDVITTGGSTLKAIEKLKAHGCEILKVMAVVDRREGGTEAIAALGLPFEALFTINDLLRLIPRK